MRVLIRWNQPFIWEKVTSNMWGTSPNFSSNHSEYWCRFSQSVINNCSAPCTLYWKNGNVFAALLQVLHDIPVFVQVSHWFALSLSLTSAVRVTVPTADWYLHSLFHTFPHHRICWCWTSKSITLGQSWKNILKQCCTRNISFSALDATAHCLSQNGVIPIIHDVISISNIGFLPKIIFY
jgi:hypothetical protein